jgi:hypothetical protein
MYLKEWRGDINMIPTNRYAIRRCLDFSLGGLIKDLIFTYNYRLQEEKRKIASEDIIQHSLISHQLKELAMGGERARNILLSMVEDCPSGGKKHFVIYRRLKDLTYEEYEEYKVKHPFYLLPKEVGSGCPIRRCYANYNNSCFIDAPILALITLSSNGFSFLLSEGRGEFKSLLKQCHRYHYDEILDEGGSGPEREPLRPYFLGLAKGNSDKRSERSERSERSDSDKRSERSERSDSHGITPASILITEHTQDTEEWLRRFFTHFSLPEWTRITTRNEGKIKEEYTTYITNLYVPEGKITSQELIDRLLFPDAKGDYSIIHSSPFLICSVHRKSLDCLLYPSSMITISNGKILYLSAVINHEKGNHYTTIFYDRYWWYVDDRCPRFFPRLTYEEMADNVSDSGRILLYEEDPKRR